MHKWLLCDINGKELALAFLEWIFHRQLFTKMTSKEETRGILRFSSTRLFKILEKTDYYMPLEETKRGNFWRKRKRSAASISVAYLQNNGLSTVKEIKTRWKRPRDVLEINGIKTEKRVLLLSKGKKKIEEGGQVSPAWASYSDVFTRRSPVRHQL